MRRRRFAALLVMGLSLLAPQASRASTTLTIRAPYQYVFSSHLCEGTPESWGKGVVGPAACKASASAKRTTGALKLSNSLASPNDGLLPGTGMVSANDGVVIFAGTGSSKKISVTFTLHVRSASAKATGQNLQAAVQSFVSSSLNLSMAHNDISGSMLSAVGAWRTQALVSSLGTTSIKNKDITATISISSKRVMGAGPLFAVLQIAGRAQLGKPVQDADVNGTRPVWMSPVRPKAIAVIGDTGMLALSIDATLTKVTIKY